MGRSWAPVLDARTKACLKRLSWWSGFDEDKAVSELLAATSSSGSISDISGEEPFDKGKRGGGSSRSGKKTGPSSEPQLPLKRRPEVPLPLPHITASYFGKVLKPNLHKCPKIDDGT